MRSSHQMAPVASDAAAWKQICNEENLRNIDRDLLLAWLRPAQPGLAEVGVTLPETGKELIDCAALARGLAKLMVADETGQLHLPGPIWESMWVIGGLSTPAIMPEILAALSAEDVGVEISGTPHPADVALRLWQADRKRAIRIYRRHYNGAEGCHPIDEEQLEEQGRMYAAEILQLSPAQAFLYWQRDKDTYYRIHREKDEEDEEDEEDFLCPKPWHQDHQGRWTTLIEKQNRAARLKTEAELAVYREWFQDLGHWRKLDPGDECFDRLDLTTCKKYKKRINRFVPERKEKLQRIKYDDARTDHKCPNDGGKEDEQVDYKWIFILAEKMQVTISIRDVRVSPSHNNSMKRQYLKTAIPYGYAVANEKCVVYFRDGTYIPFVLGGDGEISPSDKAVTGDYELQEVDQLSEPINNLRVCVDAINQKAETIKTTTQVILAQMKGVPPLVEAAAEAMEKPVEMALDIIRRCGLNPKEVEIIRAYRTYRNQSRAAKEMGITRPSYIRKLNKAKAKLAKCGVPLLSPDRPLGQPRRKNIDDYAETSSPSSEESSQWTENVDRLFTLEDK